MSGAPLKDGQQHDGQHGIAGGSSEQQPLLHERPVPRRSSTSSSSSSASSKSGRRGVLHSSSSGDTIVTVGDMPQSIHTIPEKLRKHHEWTRERFSLKWWLEWIAIFFVFSVTGSSSMMLVRPLMKVLGLDDMYEDEMVL
ncbi:hypothetical protein DFQ26_001023 [Actinomortierella ambigua]|nr:hypothetical protein DFQ26_001023 [Actinomortierella ambigua]